MSDAYQPKQSTKVNRVSFSTNESEDRGSWKEKLKVCEGVKDNGEPRVFIRSFFVNSHTEERVWDEPPSGATNIVRVTPSMRRRAEEQQRELQETLDHLPNDSASPTDQKNHHRPKKKGLFSRWFRPPPPKVLHDDSKDLNLQRAIAASMSVQEDAAVHTSLVQDEALQMAQAMRLSNGECKISEDELLQRALEESRFEAEVRQATSGVAAMPRRMEPGMDESESSVEPHTFAGKSDPNTR